MSHHKEHSFDAYCKTILRRTAANAHKQRKRLAVREIPFSGLSETELNRLCCYDDYESDKQTFTACGREIEIRCDALCLALEALTQRQRDILLLSSPLLSRLLKADAGPFQGFPAISRSWQIPNAISARTKIFAFIPLAM